MKYQSFYVICKETFTFGNVTFYGDVKYFCDQGLYKKTSLGIFHVHDNGTTESCFFYREDFEKYFYTKKELRKAKLKKLNESNL
jgi:hypothetical protein